MGFRPFHALFFLAGCQAAAPGDATSGSLPGVTTAPPPGAEGSSSGDAGSGGSSTGDAAASSASASGEDAAETVQAVFDVGVDSEGIDPEPPGCRGKIDFLFVISRAGGMHLVQDRLVDAFPKFIDIIEAKFAGFDYHIMVVDGDPEWGLSYCTSDCPKPFEMCGVPDYPCDLLDLVTECDQTFGAGVVFPAGGLASNKQCDLAGGRRYMTRDQPDLRGTFACAAQVGRSGSGWLGEALTAAMHPALYFPGGCNEGFLRHDALLMVTLISENYDWPPDKPLGSDGTPEDWAEAVLDAKHGDFEAVVMLDILDSGCPEKDRICDLVEQFPYSYVSDVYAPDLAPAFDAATDLATEACAAFVPPG